MLVLIVVVINVVLSLFITMLGLILGIDKTFISMQCFEYVKHYTNYSIIGLRGGHLLFHNIVHHQFL